MVKPAHASLLGLALVVCGTAAVAWMVTLCRFDPVGFGFFLLGCCTAAVAFFLKTPRWSRPLPLLLMLASLGVCQQHAGKVMREGRAIGAALVAQCKSAGRCPVAPEGFVGADLRRELIDDRGSARYTVDDDGLGFRLSVRNALTTARFHGGVAVELTVVPTETSRD